MAGLDYLVLTSLVAGFLLLGLTGKRRHDAAEDYFLAGRSLRWYHIGASLFATNFSASALIGITGAAYLTGVAIYNYEWVGIFALIFMALALVKVLRGSRIFTVAEFLARRYDQRSMVIYSIFLVFLLIFIDLAGALYVGGLLISSIIPSLSPSMVIFLVVSFTGIYSIAGGMRAVSRTDTLQSIVVIAGALVISVFAFLRVSALPDWQAELPENSLSLFRPIDDRAVPWPGLLTGIPVLCAYFWLTNQNMVQWVLSARSARDAQFGVLFAGLLKLPVMFIIVLPGVFAAILFPGMTEPDRIYPVLMTELLPVGAMGLVMAGLTAALMSNTDSTLHAASTIFTMDFVRRLRPETSARTLIYVARIVIVTTILVSALWAPNIGSFGSLFEYVQGVLSYSVTPFVVVYLTGIFWPRATARAAFYTLVLGLGAAILTAICNNVLNWIDIHYLFVPLPMALLCFAIMLLVSLVDPPPAPEPDLLWQHYRDTPPHALADRPLLLAIAGLTALTCALVLLFV
ncbi:MAG: sodium:solute symporter family transporter [Parvibaculales bacterium]